MAANAPGSKVQPHATSIHVEGTGLTQYLGTSTRVGSPQRWSAESHGLLISKVVVVLG